MEWSDTRSFTAFSSIVPSLRKDIHHRTTTYVRALQRCIRKTRLITMIRSNPTKSIWYLHI
jgi:hypothetical protein